MGFAWGAGGVVTDTGFGIWGVGAGSSRSLALPLLYIISPREIRMTSVKPVFAGFTAQTCLLTVTEAYQGSAGTTFIVISWEVTRDRSGDTSREAEKLPSVAVLRVVNDF